MPPRAGWNAPSQSRFHDEDSDDDNSFVRRRRDDRDEDRSRDRDRDRSRHSSRDPRGVKEEKFSANGRGINREKGPAVLEPIVPQPNKDWREAARRGPSYRPESQTGPVITHERTGEEPQRAGLRFLKREPGRESENGGSKAAKEEEDVKPTEEQLDAKPPTLDEQALAAVLAGDTGGDASAVPADFTIAMGANARNFPTEEDALRRDLEALPQESSLDDYDAVPVEAFGVAILRGMGYDPKKDTPLHLPKARPALLGLGATALSAELPPTSKKKDAKARREAYATRGGRGYNAAHLLVSRGGSESRQGSSTPRSERGDQQSDRDMVRGDRNRDSGYGTADDRRRRRDDDNRDGRDVKRRDDRDRDRERDRDHDGRRYETEEERARRKAKERERERDRDKSKDGRYRYREGRDRERDRDRDYRRDDHQDRDHDRDHLYDAKDDRRDRGRDRDERSRQERG